MATNDLFVSPLSEALLGKTIDLVVSGSIGAVESVRLIRALRRLGATVHPWLTQGGSLFTTETALSWAAAQPVHTRFEGTASHIGLHDACVIAPASASLIGKVAQGLTDTPATALVASYLGQKKPILLVPNMHDSLMESPFVASNLERLASFATILQARQEEGKQKFPDPAILADEIAHQLSQRSVKTSRILLTMGTTRGYIDSVRYISNYSSGALGSAIAEELYRYGHHVRVVAGPCQYLPRVKSEIVQVETNEAMSAAVQKISGEGLDAAIFAASVLDFVPDGQLQRKVRSDEDLKVQFVRTPKIIAQVSTPLRMKVGFKLEDAITGESEKLARDYLQRYQLSHLIMNGKHEVSAQSHIASVFTSDGGVPMRLDSKEAIARYLAREARARGIDGA
jgi:phosphopantothenoylcysteine decarboxylase/phosphopantothenate--cysteine ligase